MKHVMLRSMLATSVMACVALAQTPQPPTKGTTPAKTAPAKTAAAPAPKTTAAKTAAAPAHAAKKTAAKSEQAPAAPKPSAAVDKPAAELSASQSGKRDPFVNPIRQADEPVACNTGARCLVIAQIVLKGVIKTPAGMIAMVENPSKKEYNLHEKDVVMNGTVSKITTDSVTFSETVTDLLGRKTQREVVKKVTVPAV